jgi:hypothetical protein
MAGSQHISPKVGQADGRSPGLGDCSCCYFRHIPLPARLRGHFTCILQVVSSILHGDDSEAYLAEVTQEEVS